MAITIQAGPTGDMALGYNDIKYLVSSDNVTNPLFQYVVQVYEAGTTNSLFEKTYKPRPIDGYAEVDISREIQNKLSCTEPFDYASINNNTGITATNSYLNIDVEFGESYLYQWNFIGITQSIFSPVYLTPNCYKLIGGTGNGHDLPVPPNALAIYSYPVIVTFDIGNVPYVSGAQTAITTSTFGATNLAILALYPGPLPDIMGATSGNIKLSTNSVTIFSGLTSRNLLVTNGAMSLQNIIGYTASDYHMPRIKPSNSFDTAGSWLCDAPSNGDNSIGYTITPDQDLWIHSRGWTGTTGTNTLFINSGTQSFFGATGSSATYLIPIGPNNAGPGYSATYNDQYCIDFQETGLSWSVYRGASGSVISKKLFCPITLEHQPDPYQIAFVDRLGSIMTFAFNGTTIDRTTIDRKTLNKKLHNTVSYNTYDQSDIVRSVNVNKEIQLNSIWMTQPDSTYFEQLLTSGFTWIKMKDGLYYACIVKETGFKTQSFKNKKLIRRSVIVQLTSKTPVNI